MMKSENASTKVKVAVRVRPFSKREVDLGTKCVIDMAEDQTFLLPPEKASDKKQLKVFTFDHCFWSMDCKDADKFADQSLVFKNIGVELLENAFQGYNACIFAYGQTGSGKSYTMMGSYEQPGLIPRLCSALFEEITANTKSNNSFKVEVSFMEIYNERVRDLLDPHGAKQHLKVREHQSLGPYVDGLQQLLVASAEDIQEIMSEGNKSRTVAATKMNAESSRSHAVFTLIVTHTMTDSESGISGEKVSKISLVDLAGSERSSKTGASGIRLKEGSNINKSLTTLGLVISALADQASGKGKNKFVPYRDSVLTWILKDNLGGNSKTTMVATLSPSADNYEETLSTLRYADRAKRIVNKAIVNEDPNARIIRELREEVEKLQLQLKQSESMRAPDLQEKLQESEKLIQEISQTWEEKLRKTEHVHKKRQETLEKMGISLETSGIKVEKTKCFLVNLNADPSLNELLVYYLKPHTLVGNSEESDMQLSGLGIAQKHAEINIFENEIEMKVTLGPLDGARTCVNGQPVMIKTNLHHGDRILWGNNHFFRINIPESKMVVPCDKLAVEDGKHKLDKTPPEFASYEFAQQEVLLNQLEAPIQDTILSLEKEFHLLQKENELTTEDTSSSVLLKLEDTERKKYESEIASLRQQLLSTAQISEFSQDNACIGGNTLQSAWKNQYKNLKEERDFTLRSNIANLRESLAKAHALCREANAIAAEMNKDTKFTVTLRIPTHNLTPDRKKGTLLCEPAIEVVRQGKDCQVWAVEKLSNRLIEMREHYEVHKQLIEKNKLLPVQGIDMDQSFTDSREDPFNEIESGQSLIGVANVFLSCLLQDAPLYYPLPIISQHGQVVGKLVVCIQRVSGAIPTSIFGSWSDDDLNFGSKYVKKDQSYEKLRTEATSMSLDERCQSAQSLLDTSDTSVTSVIPQITCRVSIMEATGLAPTFSHFVVCRYTFLDCPNNTTVPPDLRLDEVSPKHRTSLNVHFNHSMEFTCNVTEELVDRLTSNASLAIEVWGHKDRYSAETARAPSQLSHLPIELSSRSCASSQPVPQNTNFRLRGSSLLSEKNKSLKERWNEVIKRIRLDVSIQELGDSSNYEAVDVLPKADVPSIGVFQLRQGQSRRIEISVSPVADSGTLPLICNSIVSVYAGSICRVMTNESGLDSYQEFDLTCLRSEWLHALDRRKVHLDKQIKNLTKKQEKTELEKERESRLFDQWVMLTEERNAVVAPTANSGVPGAPASWVPPSSCELHVPVLFLNLSGSADCDDIIRCPVGLESELPMEVPGTFVQLPVIHPSKTDFRGCMSCVVSWDSSLHDCLFMNRPTTASERLYIILKVHINLNHPKKIDIVMRKRICVSIYKQRGFAATLLKKVQRKGLQTSGVLYEVVSNIPLASYDGEDQETLALLAASDIEGKNSIVHSSTHQSSDEESSDSGHFEKYVMRATRSVDNILALDRVRQEVALRDYTLAQSESNADNVSMISKRNQSQTWSLK
ncbi:kinesin-like protein KIF13A [Clavelina lepadiformis]|uniref:kinesin-like protein KIF13A n=1 Tax=Clavelina lepadiformis TaxID=159417 RepID=UPI004041C929